MKFRSGNGTKEHIFSSQLCFDVMMCAYMSNQILVYTKKKDIKGEQIANDI